MHRYDDLSTNWRGYDYLRRRRRLCFWCGLFVCLFVCLSVGLLANLWTDYDEIFWRGRAWLKDQVIQFWWRSGSRFGSGSPKSEIRILRIGGGLCSLSTSSFTCIQFQHVQVQLQFHPCRVPAIPLPSLWYYARFVPISTDFPCNPWDSCHPYPLEAWDYIDHMGYADI